MFNLYQLVTGAQGGRALDNLAGQFGISRDQADKAVQALMPALSTAFTTKAAQPGGLSEIAGAMTDDHHRQAYVDPSLAQDPRTQQKGSDIAGSIFGNNAVVGTVIQQASHYTGIAPETLQRMLPVIISMVVGGAATAMHNQGLGGMLGQLASSGFGGMLGQMGGGGAFPGSAAAPSGDFGAMLGNIFGSFLGGGQAASPHQPVTSPPGGPATQPPADPSAAMPPIMQAGLDALLKMFQPGVAGLAGQPSDLDERIDPSRKGTR